MSYYIDTYDKLAELLNTTSVDPCLLSNPDGYIAAVRERSRIFDERCEWRRSSEELRRKIGWWKPGDKCLVCWTTAKKYIYAHLVFYRESENAMVVDAGIGGSGWDCDCADRIEIDIDTENFHGIDAPFFCYDTDEDEHRLKVTPKTVVQGVRCGSRLCLRHFNRGGSVYRFCWSDTSDKPDAVFRLIRDCVKSECGEESFYIGNGNLYRFAFHPTQERLAVFNDIYESLPAEWCKMEFADGVIEKEVERQNSLREAEVARVLAQSKKQDERQRWLAAVEANRKAKLIERRRKSVVSMDRAAEDLKYFGAATTLGEITQ